ncbi:carbon-nitrogen hydrolase family protein [Shewanella nanhaiensis]|uniref:Carbon-nitrogen hydrolase family protein n=1 Tax=Shewanella nanhaiensis TaxID=2864872 RepID=A0ABS7E1G0_9GAMM|nr:carbon-nitrogen hydrolase family protein [Shewanella nanhaiensis]MBW8182847.1 carbon-nitrogen hydrolase family protein [Shewanella nanhaiensis]
MSKVALVQESPILLDRDKTIAKAINLIEEAVENGAELVIFPEAYIAGYPAWIWRLRPGGDWGTSESLHERLLNSAICIDEGELAPLCHAAQTHQITLVCGINERDGQLSRATLYNTVVTIGPDGEVLNRHRKLMPTNPERMVWGFGDGSTLKVVETNAGRLSTLLCWENYMPLARYALYSQGVELYVAPTYDSGDDWLGTMQHIAREGRCWVICCGVALEHSDLPDDFPDKESLYPDPTEWINPGDSLVVAPGGKVVAGPMRREKGILYAEVDKHAVAISKRALDVAGHYSRPDVFSLHVNTQVQSSVKFK